MLHYPPRMSRGATLTGSGAKRARTAAGTGAQEKSIHAELKGLINSVATTHSESRRTRIALLKVIYLLAVTAAIFAIPSFEITLSVQWYVVTGFLLLQVFTLLANRIPAIEVVRPAWRLKLLLLFLAAAYAFLPPENPSATAPALLPVRIPGIGWTLTINLTGLAQAGLMCLQILTVLLASSVVRLTGRSTDLAEGLEALRLPPLFVYSLDHTLGLLGGVARGRPGEGGGDGGGGGRGGDGGAGQRRGDPAVKTGFFTILRRITKGDFSAFTQSIQANLKLAAGKAGRDNPRVDPNFARDVAVVTGVAMCMSSIKMLKFLPGIPFASGHKTLVIFPLYVLASRLTHSRWGGTAAGSIMGLIGFLQGDGRFGVLEVLKHIAPGVVIDLAEPLVRRWPSWALGYCFLGLLAGIARTATELLLLVALGARAEIYLFVAAKLVPNILFGFLSGFLTVFVLRALAPSWLSEATSVAEQGLADGGMSSARVEGTKASTRAEP